MTRPYLNILNGAYLSKAYGKTSAQPGYMAATSPKDGWGYNLLGSPGSHQWAQS